MKYLDINSDNLLELTGLTDQVDDSIISDATITAVLKADNSDTAIATLNLSADGEGAYHVVVPAASTAALTAGRQYRLCLSTAKGTGRDYTEVFCTARTKQVT